MDLQELFKSIGLEDDAIIAKAEKAVNKAIPLEFVSKDQYNKKVLELDETKKEIKEVRGELATAESYKQKVATLEEEYKNYKATKETEFTEYKSQVESEKATATKREAIRKQLAADGANQKLIGLLEKEFDLAAVELDGEGIKGWDALSKSVKETYADVFGTTQIKGTDVANPPAGGGGDKNPWLKENHSLKEQTRLYRENPALAIEMAKAAGINLQ